MPEAKALLVGSEWEFRHRTSTVIAVCAAVAAVALAIPDPFTDGRLWIELPWMCAAAFAVAAAGVAIRVWATGYLPFVIIADRKLHASKLVDTGPYGLTRNPLYLGTWLAVGSLGFVLNLWAALILPAVMALKVRRIIGFEERRLRAAFGAQSEVGEEEAVRRDHGGLDIARADDGRLLARCGRVRGVHLRLPGYSENGPTLEIFQYSELAPGTSVAVNRPGFAHIAFSVASIPEARAEVLSHGGSAVGEIVTVTLSTGAKVTWCYVSLRARTSSAFLAHPSDNPVGCE